MSSPASALERVPIGAAVLSDTHLIAANDAFARVLRTSPDTVAGTALADLLAPEDLAEVRQQAEDPGATRWLPVAGLAPDTAPWTGQLTVGEGVAADTGAGRIALLVPGRPPLELPDRPADDQHGAGPAGPWDHLGLDRVLSHDARGGLRGVKSFLTLLERDLGEALAGQAAEFHATAAAAAARTDLMLEQLVTLLRITIRPLPIAPFHVEPLLAEAMARSVEQFPGPEAAVDAGPLPTVWANRTLLVESLAELFTNARKFADGTVTIHLTAKTSGGWAYLHLADDGPGVEPELAEDAFSLYRLLQPKGRYPGVGMGLPLVRESLRAQGGRCQIVPAAPPGTTVQLRLARATPAT